MENTYHVKPQSSANFIFNTFCVVVFFGFAGAIKKLYPDLLTVWITMAALLGMVMMLWVYDLAVKKVHTRVSTGLGSVKHPKRLRILTKLWALYVTLGLLYAIYYIFYTKFNVLGMAHALELFRVLMTVFFPLSFYYFWEVDRRQINPEDEYWHAGCFLTGRWHRVDWRLLKHYLFSWTIKGFFIPFVFAILVKYVDALLNYNWTSVNFLIVMQRILDMLYMVDVLWGVLGYILTTRFLDTHIRSVEPTFLGWLVCLMCYGPFYLYFGIGLFDYNDGMYWYHWLQNIPMLYYGVAFAIVGLTAVYALATVAIGYRMSNLTYRGIITDGPYRLSKHPAYVCKVGSWWLISLPFLTSGDPAMAVKHTLALIFISAIYFLRAKTEENHLANYPEYVQYANWINDHGIFRGMFHYCPNLKFSAEKAKKWGSTVRPV